MTRHIPNRSFYTIVAITLAGILILYFGPAAMEWIREGWK